jgi:hypothetical protein
VSLASVHPRPRSACIAALATWAAWAASQEIIPVSDRLYTRSAGLTSPSATRTAPSSRNTWQCSCRRPPSPNDTASPAANPPATRPGEDLDRTAQQMASSPEGH